MTAPQHLRRLLRRAILLAATVCIWTAPLGAQPADTLAPYTLTEADAAAINLRRPPSWSPSHVSAGDVFEIDLWGNIIIPSLERRSCADCAEFMIEDLEPPTKAVTK